MIIYEATRDTFQADVRNQLIAEKIQRLFMDRFGHTISQNEYRSWENSLMYMKNVLDEEGIPGNAGIAVEFRLPYSSKRIDFIISGLDSNNQNTAVIIELKQWETAEVVSGKDAIVRTYLGGGPRDVSHPSYQAWSYAAFIEDYNESVQQHQLKLKPCAYLHNYVKGSPDPITSQDYQEYIEKAPVFIKGEAGKLSDYIKQDIVTGDEGETLKLIEHGKIRPSKSLQDALLNMMKGNQEFIMLDDQKVTYEDALKSAKDSMNDGKKRVLIVKGGPGTGKSVVAINLLVKLTSEKMNCRYVTKNAAPRNVFAAKLSGEFKKTRINNLFMGSGSFIDSEPDSFDVLLVDEAHRLNRKSGIFSNLGEHQVKEIIQAAKLSVFFLDESQRIHIKDIGTMEEIVECSEEAGAEVEILELPSQFRCNGSDGYIAWLDDVLEIRETANDIGFDMDYDFQIFDQVSVMTELIEEKNRKNNRSRILAGYCWEWASKNNPKANDIRFPEENYERQWNFSNTATWAIDKDSVAQIGCIHTSQGLEFDYVGVIIGDDMRFVDGQIETDYKKRAKTDRALSGIKKMAKENPERAQEIADELIKNTYRTLMTRGMKGCYVYCADNDLRDYLRERIKKAKIRIY